MSSSNVFITSLILPSDVGMLGLGVYRIQFDRKSDGRTVLLWQFTNKNKTLLLIRIILTRIKYS